MNPRKASSDARRTIFFRRLAATFRCSLCAGCLTASLLLPADSGSSAMFSARQLNRREISPGGHSVPTAKGIPRDRFSRSQKNLSFGHAPPLNRILSQGGVRCNRGPQWTPGGSCHDLGHRLSPPEGQRDSGQVVAIPRKPPAFALRSQNPSVRLDQSSAAHPPLARPGKWHRLPASAERNSQAGSLCHVQELTCHLPE